MKSLFTLFISLLFHLCHAQWMDSFSDNWPSMGWSGDLDEFVINSNQQLQSQFSQPGFFQLHHDLSAEENNNEISCFLRQNFAGSSNNFGRLLIYDQGIPDSVGHNNNAGVRGWVIQWGNAGSADLIQIFWNDGALWEPLAEAFPIANGAYGHFKIVQDSMVHFYFQDNDSTDFFPLLHSAIPEGFQPSHLCIQAQFTSSNVLNFYWDDFYFGPSIVPIQPMNTGKRSIVINELLPDPDPPSPLGKSEFIELYNNTPNSIWLGGWTLYNTTTAHLLPNKFIGPHDYIVLCQSDDTVFYENQCWGLESFSALTNTGDSLTLCSPDGSIVDVFQYNLETYQNPDKTAGGWSLEQRNPLLPCSGSFNWSACIHSNGATPGTHNASLDTTFHAPKPMMIDWGLDPHPHLYLWSNLPWEQDSLTIQLHNQIQMWPCTSSGDSLIVELPAYTENALLSIDSVVFCNQSLPVQIEINLPLIQTFSGQDVLLNEILFHPKEGQSPFIELYNNSDVNIALDKLWIENQSGTLHGIQRHHHFIRAHDRLALTENDLPSKCNADRVHLVTQLPYMTIEEGVIYLGHDFYKIDTLAYQDSMHHPYLIDTEGVSLERVEGDLTKETWLSASAGEGGQTPGCPNSQQWNYTLSEIQFQCTPEYFSPNQDGYQDIIAFSYQGEQAGVETQLRILSQEGYEMKTISSGEWQGLQAQWTWDGTDNTQVLCPPGLYFALLEVWTGQSSRAHKTIKSFVLSP
jgi:hypothetical protein